MATITLGELKQLWQNVSDWVKGVDTSSKPKVDIGGKSSHVSIETNATATEANLPFDVTTISVLSNDGTDSIIFNFDASTTLAGKITLKPGDVLTDFPRKCTTLYYKSNSGTQPFRAWGVK